ncbi:MAG: histidine phosphatase family protein [Geminicoccaceae bacterium]|nr:histidine phosphatase family protein [Geminicoccaceae bacterium]
MHLVRHGESAWNRRFGPTRIDPGLRDPGLTPAGEAQAREAAERLAGLGVVRLVASPYRRTLQTAALIAARLGVPVAVEPLVRERCAFSCDLGSPPAELAREWPGLALESLPAVWWGGRIESEAALERRCRVFYERASGWRDRDGTAVVSHWGFIRALTGKAVGNAEIVGVAFEADPHPGRARPGERTDRARPGEQQEG